MSGGQSQRLSFARALLKKSKILLLDEATSGLDAYNENIVLELLSKLKHKMTIVFVTHKLHISPIADKIVYIGKFGVEEGSEKELLADETSHYAKYWEEYNLLQKKKEEEERMQMK